MAPATLSTAPVEVVKLSQAGPAALALGDKYGDKYSRTEVDSKKYPNYAADRHCANDWCLVWAGRA